MERRLILTGWGGWNHNDYAYAGALALHHFNGEAQVLGMSKRRLPEFLETAGEYREIILLGIGLVEDAERLEKALKRLRKKQVKVTWLSALEIPEPFQDRFRDCLDCHVSGGDIVETVEEYYSLAPRRLVEFWDERTPLGKSYQEFIEAAGYVHRTFQSDTPYSEVIRHLAFMHRPEKWTESEREIIARYRRYGAYELVGKSNVITALQEKINTIAANNRARVLIIGESGTGKEIAATQIHVKSERGKKGEPFIAFNCASVTPNLLASAFLGYEKGAFTDAKEMHAGIFEEASGGTLFLDEIGELPLEAQGILLRVLETGRFMRMGESKREIEVNVRLVAATNRDLASMVRDGRFRADLFQRLNVILLRTPPLRSHKEDIPILARNFRNRNKMRGQLTQAQLDALMDYDYPGNIRELHNLLERADVLGITDYAQLIREHRELTAELTPRTPAESPDNLEEATRLHIRRVCEKFSNNISKAANALGVSRNTVRKYL